MKEKINKAYMYLNVEFKVYIGENYIYHIEHFEFKIDIVLNQIKLLHYIIECYNNCYKKFGKNTNSRIKLMDYSIGFKQKNKNGGGKKW